MRFSGEDHDGPLPKWARMLVLLIFMGGCGVERSFIYFPDKGLDSSPSEIGLAFDDLYIQTEDGVSINAWYVPSPGASFTVIWLHGNAGHMGHRLDQLARLHRQAPLNILMIDYRGYGRSGGHVSEEGTYRDAEAAYDYLRQGTDGQDARILAFGQSLGAAVAVELALRRNLAGLILEAPFTSIRDMRAFHYPWLPVDRFVATRYDSLSKIVRVATPVLILHGDRDEVVPYIQGQRMFEAAAEPKYFHTVQGAGHNGVYQIGGDRYFQVIREFLESLTGEAPDSGG